MYVDPEPVLYKCTVPVHLHCSACWGTVAAGVSRVAFSQKSDTQVRGREAKFKDCHLVIDNNP